MERFVEKLGIGKHSTFQATVTIHELAQVPLVSGKFRVKWRYRDATSDKLVSPFDHVHLATKSHLHSTAANTNTSTSNTTDSRSSSPGSSATATSTTANSRQFPHDDSATTASSSLLHPLSALHPVRSTSAERGPSSPSASSSSNYPESPPRPPFSKSTSSPSRNFSAGSDTFKSPPMSPGNNDRTPNPYRTPSAAQPSTFSRLNPSASTNSSPGNNNHSKESEDSYRTTFDSEDPTRRSSTLPPSLISVDHAEPKGATVWVPLRSHTATFNRKIVCPVAIALKHINQQFVLQPSPLKLSVRQEVVDDEDAKMKESRTGQVTLDLSQFVNVSKGKKESMPRLYLLRDCKTNATLRITVKMDYLSGERNYIAPPLKSGQVQSTVVPTTTTNGSGLSSTSASPFNRSTASLTKDSKKHSSVSLSNLNGAGGSSTAMSRTSSVTSASTQGGTSSAASPTNSIGKKKGWRPSGNPSNYATLSPTVGSLGNGSGTDRTASDIIELIFSPDPWRPQPASAHDRVHGESPSTNNETLEFTTGRKGKLSPSAYTNDKSFLSANTNESRSKKGWSLRPLARRHFSSKNHPQEVVETQPPTPPSKASSLRPSISRRSSQISNSSNGEKWHAGEDEPKEEEVEGYEPKKANIGITSVTRPIGETKISNHGRATAAAESLNRTNSKASSTVSNRPSSIAVGQARRDVSGTSSYHSARTDRTGRSAHSDSENEDDDDEADSDGDEEEEEDEVEDLHNTGLSRIARLARAPSSAPVSGYGRGGGIAGMKSRVHYKASHVVGKVAEEATQWKDSWAK